ncbi:MAG: hypothetical protein J07HQW1_00140 [Haloquadratum walsbyi J07HQW1]|uniref:Uncharacterized protein n=1 Tax=Haloquadratum walsbyi J07HQW1 TaxID=1238424 RepID=U1P9A0_9EURY|nr:MAG: hypothetical protein J07HQW1_00140 [Haloquadratum walsbyi J07HQW1]
MSGRDVEFDADEFLEWAEEIAESEGVSTDEILDQVVSAYWVYTELQRTLNSVADTPATDRSPREQRTKVSPDVNDNIEQQQPSPVGQRESASASASESASDLYLHLHLHLKAV